MIAVVTIHVVSPFLGYSPFFETPTYWVANIIAAVARVGVPLLVMISGYLNLGGYAYKNTTDFFRKRLKRILWPLLIWLFLYFCWSKYFMYFELNITNIYDFLATLFRGYYHMYFLYLILGLTLVTPLLHKYFSIASHLQKLLMIYGIFILAMIMTTIKGFFSPDTFTFETTFTYFLPYIAYYAAGYYLGNISTVERSRIRLSYFYAITLLITIILNYAYMKYIGWGKGYLTGLSMYFYFFEYFSPTVIMMSLSIYLLIFHSSYTTVIGRYMPTRFVQNLSSASYGVYLIHPMLIDMLNKYTVFDLSRIPSPVWIYMLGKTLIVLGLSYIIVMILRRLSIFQYLDGSN